MTMQAFEVAADQILEIIDAECADACAVQREQLAAVEGQFTAFRNAALATHASNEAINAKARHDLAQLHRTLGGLQHTLQQAGIFCSPGTLSFGPQWGAVVRGLGMGAGAPGPPLLTPRGVIFQLEAQRQEDAWRWGHNSAQMQQQHHPPKCDVYGCTEPNPSLYTPQALLPSPTIDSKASLKRRLGITPEGEPESAAKRPKAEEGPTEAIFNLSFNLPRPDASDRNTQGLVPTYNPGFNLPRSDALSKSIQAISPAFNIPRPPIPPQTSWTARVFGPVASNSTPSNAPQSLCCDTTTLLAVPLTLERWSCALIVPSIETQPSSPCILPPLSVLVGAHACSYYMWFAIRAFLFRRLDDPAQPVLVRTALSPDEWEVKLHNKKPDGGKVEYVYSAQAFALGGGPSQCACGLPPLDDKILRKLTPRADGAPVQPADFAARPLQALLLADLALAHAKLQFEATDDTLVPAARRAERAERAEARRGVFRGGWGVGFGAAPLELPDVRARRGWIARFAEVLRDWPNFATATGAAPEEGTGAGTEDEAHLDALGTYEQRLIAFYLQTVSDTLGVHPARPVQRPDVEEIPEPYRHILAQE
ncbi:hypothetical protein FB451DRAFT_1497247 [Mycena latifolia]|nr:hypothetical protein FB451DRAFT_1497247 [Mycena latifolia]